MLDASRTPQARTRERLALLLPVALWALAVNPFALPASYDNVMYVQGARSLAAHGSFTFGGFQIADWPPGLSALLAVPMALGLDSLVVAKLIVVVLAGAALWLILRVLQADGRPHPLLTTAAIGLLPTSLLAAARVMSDWPFVTAAFGTLLALSRIPRSRRPLAWGLVGGLLLAAAALTRHAGITLGAAIVAQAVARMRAAAPGQRLRSVLPEALMAVIGAGAYLAWTVHVHDVRALGLAWAYYMDNDLHRVASVDPIVVGGAFGEMFLRAPTLARVVGLPAATGAAAGLALLALAVVGATRRIRASGTRPTDWFVLVTLALLIPLTLYEPRYLLPIAPFLASDLLEGTAALGALVRAPARLLPIAAGAWLALSLALDGALLVRGNGHSHGGLSPLVSRSPDAFYRGEWLDLWQLCQATQSDDRSNVLFVGRGDLIYPALFCDRPILRLTVPASEAAIADVCATPPFPLDLGWDLAPDGHPAPPLAAPPAQRAPEDGSCSTRWVVVEKPAAIPDALPGLGPLALRGTYGTMSLLTAAAPVGDAATR